MRYRLMLATKDGGIAYDDRHITPDLVDDALAIGELSDSESEFLAGQAPYMARGDQVSFWRSQTEGDSQAPRIALIEFTRIG